MVSLASAQTVVVGTSSTAANLPYSHAAGKGVLCFVGVRLTASTDSVTTVSFNGSNFTQIFDSGPAGGASPYQRLYGFRLDDPGAANATIVATGSTTILGWNLAAFDVDGAQTGAAMVDNAATAIANSSVTVSCTLTTSSPDAYLVAVQTRAPGASMVSLSVSAPLTEFFELKGTNGADYLVQMEGSTYQTSVSGIASYDFFPSTATAARRCVGIVGLARVLPTSLCASPVTVVTGFGAAPIAVPQGFASPTAFGSVGTPVPLGKAVNAQFGGVAIAVPAGLAAATAFGTPIVANTSQGVTLGTPVSAFNSVTTALSLLFNHAAGTNILAIVAFKGSLSTDTINSVSFAGNDLVRIFDSGAAGTPGPFPSISMWRLDDPGAINNGTLVATTSREGRGTTITVMDVSGGKSGAAMIENFNSAALQTGQTATFTLTTSSPNALIVAGTIALVTASPKSIAASAPLTEFSEVKGTVGTGLTVQMEVATYQTSTSGATIYQTVNNVSSREAIGGIALATSAAATPQTINVTGFAGSGAVGLVALAVPLGVAVNTAFGAPTISQVPSSPTINPTGFGAAIAVGGVSLAVPHGNATTVAFGAPNVTVQATLSPVVTATQLAGRAWARGGFGWDDLITRWKHLQSLRQEARAALVEVRTKLRKAPSAQRPSLRGQEDDLEERIDELRRQALMLEAEIVSIDHKARADLLADDEEAIMLLL